MEATDEFPAVFGVNGRAPQNWLAAIPQDLQVTCSGRTAIVHGYNSKLGAAARCDHLRP